ncbi:MAG: hypothetical protein KGL59_13245 [Acidobacteriota bacterium]|nr:hypothetical protein [Acidobacteriota bacterium]
MALNSSSYETMHQDHGEAPKPHRGSGGLAIVLILGIGLIAALVIPSVRSRIDKFFPSTTPKRVEMGLRVWANKEAGNYSCPGSKFFGRGAGTYMRQGDALTLGYQPALGNYCQGSESSESKPLVRPARDAGHSANSSSNLSSSPNASR